MDDGRTIRGRRGTDYPGPIWSSRGVQRLPLVGQWSTAQAVSTTSTSRIARNDALSPGLEAAVFTLSAPSGAGSEFWNTFTGSGTTGRNTPTDAAAATKLSKQFGWSSSPSRS